MRHGVIVLPEQRWREASATWSLAEELGFDHAWTYDHLSWRSLRDGPWFGTMPTLTAAAMVTSRIGLGTMVATPAFRHPVPFAKELMTLDDISGGRLLCGLGSGGLGYDDVVLGGQPLPPGQRAARFAEFVQLTDLLLRQPETDYRGSFFSCSGARMHPGCVQRPRPPLAIAATGPRGMGLAARLGDLWVTAGTPAWTEPLRYEAAVPLIDRQLHALDAACAAAGRDPLTLRRLVVTGAMIRGLLDSAASYQDACGRFGAIGVTDLVVHWPRDSAPYAGSVDVLHDIAATVLGRRAGS